VPPSDSAVRVRDLTFRYPNAPAPALSNLSLEVPRGRKLLLMGPSGSGKTTLFQCLTGICPKLLGGDLDGTIEIMGQDIALLSVYDVCRSINAVFQNPDDQLCNVTVEDEVAFGLENYSTPRHEMGVVVDRCLEAVGMADVRNKYVFHLSGGQRQRLALASVLALDPPILLLDEPTSNLDPRGTHALMDIIERLTAQPDLTLVIVQRQADEIVKHVDEVAVLVEGEILLRGSPAEVLSEHGPRLRDEHGLWLPQLAELGLALRDAAGWAEPEPVPLSTDDAVRQVAALNGDTAAGVAVHGPASVFPAVAASVRDVRYTYPDDTVALDGVTFEVPERSVTALVGQNGSGKTTLAMLLVGLTRPTAGEVRVFGQKPGGRALHGQVAYVFQFPDLQFVKHSVLDELTHGLVVGGVHPAAARDRAADRLRHLGLFDRADRHPYSLSAGEKRLLSVAAMLEPRPRLLILDEPTYGLDWRTAHAVMEMVQACRAEGSTVVLITHDMRLVAEYADHAVVLVRGRRVFEGAPRTLFGSPSVLEVAALNAPPVYDVAMRTIGHGALTVQELTEALGAARELSRDDSVVACPV
jgi:energy-coupling factor transport system ATP-binding protein